MCFYKHSEFIEVIVQSFVMTVDVENCQRNIRGLSNIIRGEIDLHPS